MSRGLCTLDRAFFSPLAGDTGFVRYTEHSFPTYLNSILLDSPLVARKKKKHHEREKVGETRREGEIVLRYPPRPANVSRANTGNERSDANGSEPNDRLMSRNSKASRISKLDFEGPCESLPRAVFRIVIEARNQYPSAIN